MADMSFARKYRPKSLDEYMGKDIKQVVMNRMSDESNFPQVTLLYGTRGTGKTSIARLMAKEYLCLDRVDGHSCGKCEICQEIERTLISTSEIGVSTTCVTEVDVAADGGKANIDSVLEDAVIEPMYPYKYKVVILDEVHMLKNNIQNALLKLAEEPPKHLALILCTTNEEKLLQTLLSRCQLKIEVHRASEEDLIDRLTYVCKKENIQTSKQALQVICKQTDRVPREALMLLEDVAKSNDNVVTLDTIRKKIGGVNSSLFVDYYRASNRSLESIMLFNRKLKENNVEIKKFLDGLIKFTMDCINIKYGIAIESYPVEYVKTAKELFKMYNSPELDALLQILEHAISGMDSGDSARTELILATTAMRIGKLDIFTDGLDGQVEEARKENKASLSAYSTMIHKEEQIEESEVNNTANEIDILNTFGNAVTNLPEDIGRMVEQELGIDSLSIPLSSEDTKDSVDDGRTMTDDDLLKFFG